jgi:hypothetical protein
MPTSRTRRSVASSDFPKASLSSDAASQEGERNMLSTVKRLLTNEGVQVTRMALARHIACLGSVSLATLALAGTASAQTPIIGTDVSTFSDSFTGSFECQDELYSVTATGHTVVHFTYFEETGALHFHLVDHGKAVAIPVDGTGPSYTANFGDSDLENIRAVKQGDLLVEEDTDLFRTVARGSDGSRVFFKGHAHFTVNANGETTVRLDSARLVCT